MNTSGDETWATLRRAWIERTAHATGSIRRRQICSALGLSMAQCSADLQQLQIDHPGCLHYDLRAKLYRWTEGHTPQLPVPEFVSIFFPARES